MRGRKTWGRQARAAETCRLRTVREPGRIVLGKLRAKTRQDSPNVQRYALIKYTAPRPQPSGSAGSAFSYGRRDDAPL